MGRDAASWGYGTQALTEIQGEGQRAILDAPSRGNGVPKAWELGALMLQFEAPRAQAGLGVSGFLMALRDPKS